MSKEECCKENGHCRCSVWKCIGWGALGVLGFAALALLFGWAIMALWNWLLPNLLNLPVITYWQALGLAVLSRLLFGSMGHGFRHMHRKHHHKHGCGCGCGCHSKNSSECCSDKNSESECCKKADEVKE